MEWGREVTTFAGARKPWASLLGNSLSGAEQTSNGRICGEILPAEWSRAGLKSSLGEEQDCYIPAVKPLPPEHSQDTFLPEL